MGGSDLKVNQLSDVQSVVYKLCLAAGALIFILTRCEQVTTGESPGETYIPGYHILKTYISSNNLKFVYVIMCFPPSGYQHGWADNRKSCILNGERL